MALVAGELPASAAAGYLGNTLSKMHWQVGEPVFCQLVLSWQRNISWLVGRRFDGFPRRYGRLGEGVLKRGCLSFEKTCAVIKLAKLGSPCGGTSANAAAFIEHVDSKAGLSQGVCGAGAGNACTDDRNSV